MLQLQLPTPVRRRFRDFNVNRERTGWKEVVRRVSSKMRKFQRSLSYSATSYTHLSQHL